MVGCMLHRVMPAEALGAWLWCHGLQPVSCVQSRGTIIVSLGAMDRECLTTLQHHTCIAACLTAPMIDQHEISMSIGQVPHACTDCFVDQRGKWGTLSM